MATRPVHHTSRPLPGRNTGPTCPGGMDAGGASPWVRMVIPFPVVDPGASAGRVVSNMVGSLGDADLMERMIVATGRACTAALAGGRPMRTWDAQHESAPDLHQGRADSRCYDARRWCLDDPSWSPGVN